MPPTANATSDSSSKLAPPILKSVRFPSSEHRRTAAAGLGLATVAVLAVTTGQTVDNRTEAAATLPDERLAINDLDYRGAFRLSSDTFGDSCQQAGSVVE